MDEKANLRTLRKLERLEAGIVELHNPRRYVRTMAQRLSYLHQKRERLPPNVVRPTFLEEERDAVSWLLSQYALSSGYDVRSILVDQNQLGPLDLDRFDSIYAAVKYQRDYSGSDNNGRVSS